MDKAEWEQLVRRWDARDKRWEERDKRWEERDKRWEKTSREHDEFMRFFWGRLEEMAIEQRARHQEMMEEMRAHSAAIWSLLDRFGEGPQPAS